jgi:hypothetical protein
MLRGERTGRSVLKRVAGTESRICRDHTAEAIGARILLIRGEKVLLSSHLAQLYGVETRALNQAVKWNCDRFPEDFMLQLTEEEVSMLVSQNVIPHKNNRWGLQLCILFHSTCNLAILTPLAPSAPHKLLICLEGKTK